MDQQLHTGTTEERERPDESGVLFDSPTVASMMSLGCVQ